MSTPSPFKSLAALVGLAATAGFGLPPSLPAGYPKAQYDEDKVPTFVLPDPLVALSGQPVTSAEAWPARRAEILSLFERSVYGITPFGRPAEMTWTTESLGGPANGGNYLREEVTLMFSSAPDGPRMRVRVFLPMDGFGPVPLFLMAGTGLMPGGRGPADPAAAAFLTARGYGLATCDLGMVDPDRRDGYPEGIRAYYARLEGKPPGPDSWGTIGSWAWAMSRAMDYLETDPEVDSTRVAVIGVSRYGKVAMWAGAQDERFAMVVSIVSGCCGATLVRRGYGETVASITGYAPYWFSEHFRSYADRVNDLPVDWHMLIAAIAPRPLYIATAEQDYWNDPHGQFLAAVAAEPVYRLLGRMGLGTTDAPAVNTPVGDTIRYHCRSGGHGLNEFDWKQFADFADRALKPGAGE